MNVKGAAIGTMIAYVTAMILNDYCVRKYTGVTHNIVLTYVRPFLAAALMAVWTYGSYFALMKALAGHSATGANALACGISILSSMAVYAVLIFLVKAITVDEIEEGFPGGARIAGVLRRVIH